MTQMQTLASLQSSYQDRVAENAVRRLNEEIQRQPFRAEWCTALVFAEKDPRVIDSILWKRLGVGDPAFMDRQGETWGFSYPDTLFGYTIGAVNEKVYDRDPNKEISYFLEHPSFKTFLANLTKEITIKEMWVNRTGDALELGVVIAVDNKSGKRIADAPAS